MSHTITIYEKPTCSTCRNVKKAFDAHGIDFNAVNYIIEPLSKSVLTKMIAGLDVEAKALVRTNEEEYKALGVNVASMTNAQIVDLLVAHPAIMQRPVVEYNGKYILGRPVDKIEAFLATIAKT